MIVAEHTEINYQSTFGGVQKAIISLVGDLKQLKKFSRELKLDKSIPLIDDVIERVLRLRELMSTHPLIHKRIEALRLFAECDVLTRWREDMALPNVRGKAETDLLCEQFIKVLAKGYQAPQASESQPRTIEIN